ncbi:MAG: NusG domain II-containing protein [Clostridia bacterium]|nr:NusG domain II-containing protein [Clostridia bacterium]
MKSNVKLICFFVLLCAFCCAVWFIHKNNSEEEIIAQIKLGNTVVKTINLSELTEPYEFKIKTDDGGYNLIRAEYGKIAVIDSDCPDKICVNQGYICSGDLPIVCLPHRMSVIIKGKEQFDAAAGGM